MKYAKRILSLMLMVSVLAGILIFPAFADRKIVSAPDAKHGIYYVDDAGCLSSTTKDYINRQNIAWIISTIWTLSSTPGRYSTNGA